MWPYVTLLFVALVVAALLMPIEKPAPSARFEDHNGRAISEADFNAQLAKDTKTNARLEGFAAVHKREREEEIAPSPGSSGK